MTTDFTTIPPISRTRLPPKKAPRQVYIQHPITSPNSVAHEITFLLHYPLTSESHLSLLALVIIIITRLLTHNANQPCILIQAHSISIDKSNVITLPSNLSLNLRLTLDNWQNSSRNDLESQRADIQNLYFDITRHASSVTEAGLQILESLNFDTSLQDIENQADNETVVKLENAQRRLHGGELRSQFVLLRTALDQLEMAILDDISKIFLAAYSDTVISRVGLEELSDVYEALTPEVQRFTLKVGTDKNGYERQVFWWCLQTNAKTAHRNLAIFDHWICGRSQRHIAAIFNLSQPTINKIINENIRQALTTGSEFAGVHERLAAGCRLDIDWGSVKRRANPNNFICLLNRDDAVVARGLPEIQSILGGAQM